MKLPQLLSRPAVTAVLITCFASTAAALRSRVASAASIAALAKRGNQFQHQNQQVPDTKYFHEPGLSEVLGHYDVRYYLGDPVSYEERSDTLYHLIRAYLTTFRELNIETWIAHGTLLGWWWNGQIMPWDWDLDVQVSASTLTWLGDNLNMTMHKYTDVAEDGTEVKREYLLDINPNHVERVRGDGQNVIDARFIDVRNGLFIDITGLSETLPAARPGIWSCKNQHRYRTRDLYPLRETEFEGVPALVPYSFDRILTEEYGGKALTSTFHLGHRWIPDQKKWVQELKEDGTPAEKSISVQRAGSAVQKRDLKAHLPRSVQEKPRAGLGNLRRLL